MDSSVCNWSVEKLIDACLSRPAQEAAWQEFVRRFHPTIQNSVSNVFAYVTKNENGIKQEWFEDIVQDLVQDVYCKLTQNDSAALRAMNCSGVRSVKNYLLLLSINTVRAYFRAPARDLDNRRVIAYAGIPFEMCYPLSHKHAHQSS